MVSISFGWMVARVLVHGCAGVGVFLGIYQIFQMGQRYRWVNRSFQYVITQTNQAQKKRDLSYQKQYEEVGMLDHMPLLQRWDQMYSQSMIQKKIPYLNAQLFASLLVMAAAILGILGLVLFRNRPGLGIGVGCLLFTLVLFGGVFCVGLIRKTKWMQTEKELVPFLNIVDNFSKSERDLFQIFDASVPYLREPIKTALAECSSHAMATGNRMEAIRELLYRLEHPKFREIVQHLDICSRNEANYPQILGDMRDSLSVYMSSRKEEAAILREGQIQIVVIICLGIPMVLMLSAITKVPVSDLASNLFGKFIILYWIVLLLVIAYQMFFASTRKES